MATPLREVEVAAQPSALRTAAGDPHCHDSASPSATIAGSASLAFSSA